MGNSIQKKKRKKEEREKEKNISSASSLNTVREKTGGVWLFGRADKLKTAAPKSNEDQKRLTVHYTTSQHQQENVFIEGNRPQYLEDLHTEAQEGLKILQQEEHNNGENFADDDSVSSTDTLRPEPNVSSKDGGGSAESEATTGNTDTTVTSSVLTRPVLTRQGSTFKPLNPVKRLDKSRKRNRRTTIMGIPNQVHKELALHRSSTFQPLVSAQLPNQDGQVNDSQSGVVIIPTVDGGTLAENNEGARVHLSELEASRDEQLFRKHLQTIYQEEQPLIHQGFNSPLCPTFTLRPKSLAVPGMTTSPSCCPSSMLSFLQEPQGPVMSISPQATYMSTIIPNAVLPASVEVIEIDRSSSWTHSSSINHGGSARTRSKSSLASRDSSISPLLPRRSDGDHSQTDLTSTQIPISTSGSNWSESQSSKTIISGSSPVSSKGSRTSGNSQRVSLNGQKTQQGHSGGDQDHVSLCSSTGGISIPNSEGENLLTVPGSESTVSNLATAGEDSKNKLNFTRSLSVMKTKQPPAPPQRTNSLHSNKIRSSSKVLVECNDLNDSSSGEVERTSQNTVKDEIDLVTGATIKSTAALSNSAGSTSDVSSSLLSPTQSSFRKSERLPEPLAESMSSSPQRNASEAEKFERTMSPSSGYSSQSGTPTHSPKGVSPISPEKQTKPVKPERSASRASSSAASPSSSLTSLSSSASEPVNPDVSICSPSLPPQGASLMFIPNKFMTNNHSSDIKVEHKELLNIPPPPKVKAPCPPPPETWIHNRCTFELLCGPSSSFGKETHKPPAVPDSTVTQTGTKTQARKELQDSIEKKIVVRHVLDSESEAIFETLLTTDPEDVHKELEHREWPSAETESAETRADVQKQEQRSDQVKNHKNQESQKKDPPPVMKKPMVIVHKEKLVTREQMDKGQQREMSCSTQIKVLLAGEDHAKSSQNGVMIVVDNNDYETEAQSIETLAIEAPKVNKVSPPPTPPPANHPTPPPSRKTPPLSSMSPAPEELQRAEEEESHTGESCWPPPPPPLEGDSVFDGVDEGDFPPPPPFVTGSVSDVMDSCVQKLDIFHGSTVATQEVEETNKDSGEAGTSVQEQHVDLSGAVPQSAVYDNKPDVSTQLSKSNSVDGISCQTEQNVQSLSDSVQPTPAPVSPPTPAPVTPITKAEEPVSVHALVPPSSFLRRDSLKTEDQSSSGPSVSAQTHITVPAAPPLPADSIPHGVNFRRQPSGANRDSRSKELLSRHKSIPIPKEDANIPLVTPSLLQMVRLRSVNMTEEQMTATSEDQSTNQGAVVQENCPVPGPQIIPQKPVRKALSLKSPPQTIKTSFVTMNPPSMRLQEAIRMKTAAMSYRDGIPSRLGVRSPTNSCVSEPGTLPLKSPEGCDLYKSPASTASFIFSRSMKKVVIETTAASSSEAQASLKQSLAAELMQVSDQPKGATLSNGGVRCEKVPPPVAKKPANGSISPSLHHPAHSEKMECCAESIGVPPTGGITPPDTTTRVTADTIETLF